MLTGRKTLSLTLQPRLFPDHPHPPALPAPSPQGVRYVLEMKLGWFERHKIAPGVIVRTERGTLGASFFRQ